jgi:prephenate dehydrogenase
MHLKIAIIGGYGKMGKWFAHYLLKEGFEIVLSGRDREKGEAFKQELGFQTFSNIEAVQKADVVLISVNIDSFTEVVKEIAPHIKPGQMVFDITSVKESPVKDMHLYLKSARTLGTHPLFGPGAKDLNSQNFVLTPSNPQEIELAGRVKTYLEAKGARITIMSAREHDEIMTVVLGLAHFISIVSADTLISMNNLTRFKAVGGSTYRVLSTLVESVISEDPELYATLQIHLPGLADIEGKYITNAVKWAEYVKTQDKQGFKDNMIALKNKFAESNSNFGQAYENMYKIMEWL